MLPPGKIIVSDSQCQNMMYELRIKLFRHENNGAT